MPIDYNAIAKQYGAIDSSTSSKQKVDYNAVAAKFGGTTVLTTQPKTQTSTPDQNQGGSSVIGGLISAPATMVARPLQATQGLFQYASDAPKINQYEQDASAINAEQEKLVNDLHTARQSGQDTTAIKARLAELNNQLLGKGQEIQPTLDRKVFSGGPVAEAPKNFGDVTKDVGRGLQTVAFGVNPVIGGGLFGAGSSLESQGSDVFSGQGLENLAISTGLGLAGGKLLDFVGKPVINKLTGAVSTITPAFLKDLSAKGAGAVSDFMAQHEILPKGVSEAVNKIPTIADQAEKNINDLFNKGGTAIKSAVQAQYPGLTKDNIAKHYEKVELDRLFEPANTSGKTFNKSSDALTQSKKMGVDLRRVAADNKIYASDLIKDGKFDTTATADALASEAMRGGPDVLRPALAAAEPSVQRVPISEVRDEIISRIDKTPDSKLSVQQKENLKAKVNREYGDGSPTANKYKDGYSLTNLYDSKLQTSSGLYKTPKGGGATSISDKIISQGKQIESQVFDDLLRGRAPKELGLDKYFKAQQDKFQLANYLRTLDGNKAPQTLFQRGVKRAAQLGGATTGASIGGPFGMFSGYQFGGILADTFGNASNPVKVAFLKSIGKTEPEIYQIMRQFTTDANTAKALRQALPAGSSVDRNLSKLFNESGAIEMGAPSHPITAADRFNNNTRQKLNQLFNTKQLPAPSPRIITSNRGGTPNRISDLYGPGGDQGEVGGLRQRRRGK